MLRKGLGRTLWCPEKGKGRGNDKTPFFLYKESSGAMTGSAMGKPSRRVAPHKVGQ